MYVSDQTRIVVSSIAERVRLIQNDALAYRAPSLSIPSSERFADMSERQRCTVEQREAEEVQRRNEIRSVAPSYVVANTFTSPMRMSNASVRSAMSRRDVVDYAMKRVAAVPAVTRIPHDKRWEALGNFRDSMRHHESRVATNQLIQNAQRAASATPYDAVVDHFAPRDASGAVRSSKALFRHPTPELPDNADPPQRGPWYATNPATTTTTTATRSPSQVNPADRLVGRGRSIPGLDGGGQQQQEISAIVGANEDDMRAATEYTAQLKKENTTNARDRVVGQALYSNEAMMGRDRGAAATNFAAYGDRGVSSNDHDDGHDDDDQQNPPPTDFTATARPQDTNKNRNARLTAEQARTVLNAQDFTHRIQVAGRGSSQQARREDDPASKITSAVLLNERIQKRADRLLGRDPHSNNASILKGPLRASSSAHSPGSWVAASRSPDRASYFVRGLGSRGDNTATSLRSASAFSGQ